MTQEFESLSLGQQLKSAREALNLSLEQAAQHTNFKRSHLDALENDNFIFPGIPAPFVRGYVRRYVRFLRLPESLVDSINYGESSLSNVAEPSTIKISNSKSQTRWLKWLTYLVLIAAIGMTAAWWWQEQHKAQSTVETTNIQPQQAVENPQNTATETAQATEEPQPSSEPAAANSEVAPLQPAVVEVVETVPVAAQTSIEQTVAEQLQATETESQPPQPEAANAELRIEIHNGESWLAVFNGKGKRLVEKLFSAGEVIDLNDQEQYQLTIGAPANVKIYYLGQEVPLRIDGRVVRIRLPLAN